MRIRNLHSRNLSEFDGAITQNVQPSATLNVAEIPSSNLQRNPRRRLTIQSASARFALEDWIFFGNWSLEFSDESMIAVGWTEHVSCSKSATPLTFASYREP